MTVQELINVLNKVTGIDSPDLWTDDNGVNITGAMDSSYTLKQVDVGKTITVDVTYIDDLNATEVITSAPTDVVININDIGAVVISGTLEQGQTLLAAVSDADGTSTSSFIYQWKHGMADIAGATASSYIMETARHRFKSFT